MSTTRRRKTRQFPHKGNTFRSRYELAQAKRLEELNIPFDYECHIIEYLEDIGNGECLDCHSNNVAKGRVYTPDFYFPLTNIYVETKGKFDQEGRKKMKNVCTQTEEDVRMVFMRDNWLTRKHSMNYSRWCELNGIECAIGDIPLEWTGCSG